MPALAEFLKGTVKDTLTSVVQPPGLIPAAVFILLNLGAVLPRAKSEKVGLAEAYYDVGDAWQAVIVTALTFVLGYLLLSGSGIVLDTLSGRTWRSSLLAIVLRWIRSNRRDRLERRIKAMEEGHGDVERYDSLRWRLRTRFSPLGHRPATTSLGDVLLASEHGIRRRYGVTVAALWEPLRTVVTNDDAAVKAAGDARVTLDLMANLTFVAALFVAEAAVVFTLWGDQRAVVSSSLALFAGYVAYRVTVTKAISWADALDTAIARHSGELFKHLGIPEPKDGAARHKKLERLSDFMLRDESDDALFGDAAPAAPTVTATPNLEVEVAEFAERRPRRGSPAREQRSSIHFLASATRKSANKPPWTATGVFVFTDERFPRVPTAPEGAKLITAGTADGTDALRWPIEVMGGGAAVREFRLDFWAVSVGEGFKVSVHEYTKDSRFVDVRRTGTDPKVEVHVFHTEDGVTHEVAEGAGAEMTGRAGDRIFTLTWPSQGVSHLRFSYALKKRPA